MLNKEKNIRPDIEGEMDELQRFSQELSRDEDIKVSVDEIIQSLEKSQEQLLTNEIWGTLENTESNEIEQGDWKTVNKIAREYKKTSPKVLKKEIESDEYKRPLIAKLGDRYILMAGNTRLCTAAAMGVNLNVFIAEINVDDEINEKWSEKYKKSIDCNNPKGFSQRAHCQGRKKKVNETEEIKGGLADNKTLVQLAKKHDAKGYYHIQDMIKSLKKQIEMGLKVEMEHTNDKDKAMEITMDHLWEDPNYYSKLKKMETKESMGADSSGAFVGPTFGGVIKKKDLYKSGNYKKYNVNEEEVKEATDASSSGPYDAPFGDGGKNPLKINGPESIKKSRAVKDKNFPKWGGPGGIFIKIKEKCKKYPYCNQGDINAIELLEIKNEVVEISEKYGIPYKEMEKIVLNEINKIFISMNLSDINSLIESIAKEEVKNMILSESEGNKKEVYHIKLEGEPIDTFKSREEAEKVLPKYQEKEKGELIIEPEVYESYEDMIEKMDLLGQELEEKENQNMKNQEPMEGNAFAYAALKAKESGKKSFKFKGKEHDVEESWKQLEEEEGMCYECGDKSMEEKLVGNQDKLDKDKDGDIGADDLADLRAGKEGEVKEEDDEDVVFTIWSKYSEDAYNEHKPDTFSDEFEFADNIISHVVQSAIANGECDEEDEDDLTDELKQEFALDIFDEYRQEVGDDDEEEEELDEEKKTCNECGSMLNEEGMCSECGSMMNESKTKKKTIRLTESEMVELIKKMVNESVPGEVVTKKAQSQSKKDNEDNAKKVGEKISKATKIEGSDNPEFPHQNNSGTKVARQNNEEENEFVEDNRGGKSIDLDYDHEPSDKFKKRLKSALEGDSKMGNSQEAANVVKSDLGEKLAKQAERKGKKDKEAPRYNKEPQPVKDVNESEKQVSSVLKEEIEKMKKIASYNKKTQ